MIAIIWSGRGILVPILTFLCLLLSDAITAAYFHDKDYYAAHGWPKLVGFLVAAGLVWIFAPRPAPKETDPDLLPYEQLTPPDNEDAFFFVPMRYWPVILSVLGVIFYFIPG
jgi:hypothetical protein